MFNVDRWNRYSNQKYVAKGWHHNEGRLAQENWAELTPRQLRRCKKKALKHDDWSIGLPMKNPRVMPHPPVWPNYIDRANKDDDPANHPIDCTCIFCIPGA